MNGTKQELSPGVWRLRVYVGRRANGSPIQRSKTVRVAEKNPKPGAGVRMADLELHRMITEAKKGAGGAGIETVGELVDRYIDYAETVKGRSPTTIREYRRQAEKVIKSETGIGKIKVAKLSALDLDNLYARLAKRGNSGATVRRIHALVGAALHQGEKWGLVERNIALRASPPEVRTPDVEAPGVADVQRIIDAAEAIEPTLAAMLLTAALTGARRGELCGLRWSDYDPDGRTLTIQRSVYETAGGGWAIKDTKSHQRRRVALDGAALAILLRHRKQVDALADQLGVEAPDDAFMFSRSPAGVEPIRPDVITKFTIRVAKKAGVDTHLHALRHFSATQAIALGYDVRTVAGRLGHRDPNITLRTYAHAVEQRDRDLAGDLGRVLALPS